MTITINNSWGIPQNWIDVYEEWRNNTLTGWPLTISGPFYIHYTWMQSVYREPSVYGYTDDIRVQTISVNTLKILPPNGMGQKTVIPEITYGVGYLSSTSFSVSKMGGYAILTIQIYNTSTYITGGWEWSYIGAYDRYDNDHSTDFLPGGNGEIHYGIPGSYILKLTTSDGQFHEQPIYVIDRDSPPIEVESVEGSLYKYKFSSNRIYDDSQNVDWNFGDDTISHEHSPIHEYSNIGNYKVSLHIDYI